jgi:CBS domain-containing protein
MANNPLWIQSLDSWVNQFQQWIKISEPKELLDFSIFFDLRCAYGSQLLVTRLLDLIGLDLKANPIFFAHLAQNTLTVKPPTHLSGAAQSRRSEEAPNERINLKDLLFPLVGIARLYALYHGVHETNTVERINILSRMNVIHPRTSDDLIKSIEGLNELRFHNQITAIQMNRVPENSIPLESIKKADLEFLQKTISLVKLMQKRVGSDFLGGTQA